MTIAITGSSGFIGSELVNHFLKMGYKVHLLQRSEPTCVPDGALFVPFDLRDESFVLNPMPDVLVHCAFIPLSASQPDAEEVNIAATMRLHNACHASGTRFIFLSTMSAHAEAESVYGRHKYRLEQMMDADRDTVLKLGLVVGDSGGLFKRISDTLARTTLVPLVDGGIQPIQTVGVDEVCQAVETVMKQGVTGLFLLGSEEVVTLRQLYALIGEVRGQRLRFLSLPYTLFDLALTLLGLLPLRLPVSKENLLGLKCLRSFNTKNDLQCLSIKLRPLRLTIERYALQ
jgi:nucleoside-diphosphate-sugar epimerase